jgi:Pyruvate/2-oxoacid:ferredoxin oxidoreductase delta subunit
MGLRKIVRIDEDLCTGCGDCLVACAEAAIQLVDGKARLVRDIYCDGLGACLGTCPEGAITIEEREAADFDEEAVRRRKALHTRGEAGAPAVGTTSRAPALAVVQPGPAGPGPAGCAAPPTASGGCPGSALRKLPVMADPPPPGRAIAQGEGGSQLGHWPVQLRLVPAGAPFLAGADLVVCADCVPFAVPDFHARYLAGRAVVVACPKLDDRAEIDARLAAIAREARPRRMTVVRMEVPCCAGIASAAVRAAGQAGLESPVEDHVVAVAGGVKVTPVR